MGRELRRKQAKRDGKNVREVQKKNKEKPLSPKVFAMILVLLLLFFVALYILTGLFITKEIKWFDSNDKNTTEIENKILAADSLKQKDEEYYVYFYDATKEDSDLSESLSMLLEKVYRVDLNDGFNSNFIGEPSGIVDDITNLKVEDPTVIRVAFGEILDFYSGAEEIRIALG